MPRPGPRRPAKTLRLSEDGVIHIEQRADEEADGNFSEMIRRMLAYATARMPKGWRPKPEPSPDSAPQARGKKTTT